LQRLALVRRGCGDVTVLWWETVVDTVVAEFSDVADVEQLTRLLVRLSLAALLGGLLGMQRERHGKAAGVRTHMLVALGAALFILAPGLSGMDNDALSRVVQGVVAGIGFLCAGTILKSNDDQIQGLTTAAGLWLTAAVGVAVGTGREATAVLSTLLALAILSLEGPLRRLAGSRKKGGEDSDE
jgi:putative Mg2+ transporter-C (MgtC) family protein